MLKGGVGGVTVAGVLVVVSLLAGTVAPDAGAAVICPAPRAPSIDAAPVSSPGPVPAAAPLRQRPGGFGLNRCQSVPAGGGAGRFSAAGVGPDWVEQGPGPTTGGQVTGMTAQGNPVAGAVSSLAADPTSASILYAGTVNGGVWRTSNATANSPTWTPLTDHLPSLAISELSLSPASAATVYAGTGSFSSGGFDGGTGAGLYKSTDQGVSWSVLGTAQFGNRGFGAVLPTSLGFGQVVLAGLFDNSPGHDGVWRSANGGASWTRISGTGGLPEGGVSALVSDPGNPKRIYVAVRTGSIGIYRSDDGGLTWVPKNAGLAFPSGAYRIELAAHHDATHDVLYAAVLTQATVTSVFRSANLGVSWTAMDLPPSIYPGQQAIVHGALLADRVSPNVVFISGDRQNGPFPNADGAVNYTGRVFRGDATLAAGHQWASVTDNGAHGTGPHADSRRMVFDAQGNLIQANDGGIYKLVSPDATTRRWVSQIGSLRPTEFYSVAYDHLTHTVFGGAQDTGTTQQMAPNGLTTPWQQHLQGDGTLVAVDDASSPGKSIRYASYPYLSGFERSTYDSGGHVLSTAFPALIVNGSGLDLRSLDPNIRFVQPWVLNSVDPKRMLIGTANLFESTDMGDSLTNVTGFLGFYVQGMAYGGRFAGVSNPDVIYFGTGAGGGTVKLRTTAGGSFRTLTNYHGATPYKIALDPQNWKRVCLIDYNSRVWCSPDAGVTWNDVTGNLAALPVSSLRTLSFVASPTSTVDDYLVVGGLGGVFGVKNALAIGSHTWSKVGSVLPDVLVTDVRYDATADVLSAGTFGRGAWTLTDPE